MNKGKKSHQIPCSSAVFFQITFIGLFPAHSTTWFKLE